MTEIAFHFNAPQPMDYLCRLLRKATAGGSRVGVIAPMPELDELDQRLWTFSATDFLAHCRADSDPELVQASPVVLADRTDSVPHADVLVNRNPAVPEGFERFARVIEVVGQSEAERQQARQRWRHYADRGYAIQRHDLTLKPDR